MTDPQWGFLTSRTFPQLQPLHCAPPPLPPFQISLVPDKNGQIRKRDSERSSIVFSFCRSFQPLYRAFPALPVAQSALTMEESRSSMAFVNLLSAVDGFSQCESYTKPSFQPLSLQYCVITLPTTQRALALVLHWKIEPSKWDPERSLPFPLLAHSLHTSNSTSHNPKYTGSGVWIWSLSTCQHLQLMASHYPSTC